MMINDSLEEYYRMNAILTRDWNYTIEDLEMMIPFEREVYTSLIIQHLENEKNKNNH